MYERDDIQMALLCRCIGSNVYCHSRGTAMTRYPAHQKWDKSLTALFGGESFIGGAMCTAQINTDENEYLPGH
jgi:predicted CxxxxCH...CXXCH cytochrome family protein